MPSHLPVIMELYTAGNAAPVCALTITPYSVSEYSFLFKYTQDGASESQMVVNNPKSFTAMLNKFKYETPFEHVVMKIPEHPTMSAELDSTGLVHFYNYIDTQIKFMATDRDWPVA